MRKWSDEQIIEILKNLADQLGRNRLTKKDVASVMPESTVRGRFGSLAHALEAAGLRTTDKGANLRSYGRSISDNDLFEALYRLELEIDCEPTISECRARCKYSVSPYMRRFGKWPAVLAHYRKWKSENEHMTPGISAQESPDSDDTPATAGSEDEATGRVPPLPAVTSWKKPPGRLYGELINFRGLRHAPVNEQGVVFLFAMVSEELGFNIEAVPQGFPNCEGTYLYDPKKNLWGKARIEFEYKASAFEQHGHDRNQCDFIVCWENDWPECPMNVIELKTQVRKLPSRR